MAIAKPLYSDLHCFHTTPSAALLQSSPLLNVPNIFLVIKDRVHSYFVCVPLQELFSLLLRHVVSSGATQNSVTNCPGDKMRIHNTRVFAHKFNNRELHTWHIFNNTTGSAIGVSSLANKLHFASKNLQNKHLITVRTGFGNTRAPKTHHTMRNSRRLVRYKAHGFFLAT